MNAHHLPEDGSLPRARAYSSALRSKQQELAREMILRATAEAAAEDPLLGFSMQEVACRADVSLRSLYRHFPTRRRLFEALHDWGADHADVAGLVEPLEVLEDLPAVAHELFVRFETDRAVVRAGVISSLSMGAQPERQREWDRMAERLFQDSGLKLGEAEAREAFAVVRLLFTGRVWLSLTERFGLDTRAAADAVEWASSTLIADLKARSGRPAGTPLRGGEIE